MVPSYIFDNVVSINVLVPSYISAGIGSILLSGHWFHLAYRDIGSSMRMEILIPSCISAGIGSSMPLRIIYIRYWFHLVYRHIGSSMRMEISEPIKTQFLLAWI